MQSSVELDKTLDERHKQIQRGRIESARRSMRSGLYLLKMAADVLAYKGNQAGALQMRENIRDIEMQLADIDAIAQQQFGNHGQ